MHTLCVHAGIFSTWPALYSMKHSHPFLFLPSSLLYSSSLEISLAWILCSLPALQQHMHPIQKGLAWWCEAARVGIYPFCSPYFTNYLSFATWSYVEEDTRGFFAYQVAMDGGSHLAVLGRLYLSTLVSFELELGLTAAFCCTVCVSWEWMLLWQT